MYKVFLSGPITGMSYDDCLLWRTYVQQNLAPGIVGISALRGREHLRANPVIRNDQDGNILSSPKGITARDRFDTMRCDVLLVNLLGATSISIGTVLEIGWADALQKPIVTVMEPGNVHDHGMIRTISSFVVHSLDEGIRLVEAILLP